LFAKNGSLSRFIDSHADSSSKRRSNQSFLQRCRHGDGFGGGGSCSSGESCSRKRSCRKRGGQSSGRKGNGVGGQQRGKRTGGRRHAPARETGVQPFQRAAHPFLRGVVTDAEGRANRAEIAVLEEAQ